MPSNLAHDLARDGASTIAPNGPSSIHTMLREATRAQHRALDAAWSRFDLTDAEAYRQFLLAHRQALVVLIDCCSRDDQREFAPLVTLVEADLGWVDAPREKGLDLPLHDPATEAGVAYVLRGSRLGAPFVRRRVAADFAARYLDHPLTTPWTTFLSRLEATVPRTAHATSAVIDAARMAFGVFARTVDVQSAATGSPESSIPTSLRQRATQATRLRTRLGNGTPEEIK